MDAACVQLPTPVYRVFSMSPGNRRERYKTTSKDFPAKRHERVDLSSKASNLVASSAERLDEFTIPIAYYRRRRSSYSLLKDSEWLCS